MNRTRSPGSAPRCFSKTADYPGAAGYFECKHGSPLGEMRLWSDGQSLTGLYFFDQSDCPASNPLADIHQYQAAEAVAARMLLERACAELDAYFSGRLRQFTIPVAWRGTPFQERVWRGLLDIPYGEVLSYGEFARRLGLSVGHARAVGLANGANPVSLLVPCHRVIGASGQLVGYGGGLPRKRYLLALERGPDMQAELFPDQRS